jgi:hypothetical protein
MKDIVVAFVGAAVISGLLMSKKDVIREDWGNLPARSVAVEKIMQVENKCGAGEGAQQNLGSNIVGNDGFFMAPPSLQSILPPRFNNVGMPADIRYNTPDSQYMGTPANALTFGASNVNNLPSGDIPACAKNGSCGGMKENYEDERYEPISQAARVAPAAQQQAQALADMGIIKARNQPNITVDTECGPASVTVYDRLIFSNQKSRLYGQGDPIRGDIGCIVPIKDAWFRPSVRPNIDLRAGALSIMGGIDNDTPRELRALQNIYSAGVSNIQNDAWANQVAPAQAQKSMSISGPFSAQADISVTASP